MGHKVACKLAFATGIVVAGDMSIAHMRLGICTDVPWVVDDNDLGLQIGFVFGTLDHGIAD